jgi:type 1 fimbriae regulatory protein FimB/type 1 fimbriae regulatory protein FimE
MWRDSRIAPHCGQSMMPLRHATGCALANKGHETQALQVYLGHRNIEHTVRRTELSPDRFKDLLALNRPDLGPVD